MIHFNVPPFVGTEFEYMKQAVDNHKICGDGEFTKKCDKWLQDNLHVEKAMLTTSGSTALDMAALLCDVQPGAFSSLGVTIACLWTFVFHTMVFIHGLVSD